MAKRMDRSRIEAGKVDLPRRAAFLATEKVDYVAVIDRDGELSVELSVSALGRLVKARGELKALKSDNKKAANDASTTLETEKKAHDETRRALSRVERRVKALEKKLNQEAGTKGRDPSPASTPAPSALPAGNGTMSDRSPLSTEQE